MICDICKAVLLPVKPETIPICRAECSVCGTIVDICIDCYNNEPSFTCPDCLAEIPFADFQSNGEV